MRTSRRVFAIEGLEPRVCLSAPSTTPYATIKLPTDGHWTTTPINGSPIFADLIGDGRQELIVEASGGRILAYQSDANGNISLYREYDSGSTGDFKSTPVVVTLANGHKGIFAGIGLNESNNAAIEDGRIFGWDATTGQILPGWPVSTGQNSSGYTGVVGPLTVAELDGDGVPEIIATSFSHYITVYKLDGGILWKFDNNDTIISGPVVGDIDRDGKPEVVFGGDSSNNGYFQAGGLINVLNANGQALYRIPIGETAWSSPVLADLQGNGTLDIVAGTGLNYDIANLAGARAAGNRLYAYDPQGQPLPGWPYHTTSDDTLQRQTYAAPAIADLYGNGQLETIIADRAGVLHVIQSNGQDVPAFAGGKPIAPGGPSSQGDNYSPAIVADATGDGKPDIIAAYGGYLTIFDNQGNIVFQTSGNSFMPTFSAPAVGQFDGVGGLELASVTNNPNDPNYPALVRLFHLPQSSLAPPWPSQRRTSSGQASMYSTSFVFNYVNQAYQALLHRAPSPAEASYAQTQILNGSIDPFQLPNFLATSSEARGNEVDQLYSKYIGRAPSGDERNSLIGSLATMTVRQVADLFMTSPEFAQVAGGTPTGIITRYYQTVLGRNPAPVEVGGWLQLVGSGTSLAAVAGKFLDSPENILQRVGPIYSTLGYSSVPDDSLAAIEFDLRHGAREETVDAAIVGSGGNYAATNQLAGWVRTSFRDILNRQAAPSEVAAWLRAFDAGTFPPSAFPTVLLNSPEAHALFIGQEVPQLLGRPADPATIAALSNYTSRENAIAAIVSSPEYFAHSGGSPTSFVVAAYRDLAGLDLSNPAFSATLNGLVQQIQTGAATPASLANQLVHSSLYQNQFAVNAIFQYIPDESMGVLRTSNLPPTAPGQPVNPPSGEVAFFVNQLQAGTASDAVLAEMLSSPQYIANSAYNKGFYRSIGIRN